MSDELLDRANALLSRLATSREMALYIGRNSPYGREVDRWVQDYALWLNPPLVCNTPISEAAGDVRSFMFAPLPGKMQLLDEPKAVPEGTLMVGLTRDQREVVINHPQLLTDKNGAGYIVFSADQARNLANLLLKKADEVKA